MTRPLLLALFCAPVALSAFPAVAQTPPDIADLIGARGAGGETQMEARGYRFLRTETVRNAKWSYWWSDRLRQCVQISTMDGRYAAINRIPEATCNQSSGYASRPDRPGGARPPIGDGGYADTYDSDGSLTLICYGEGRKPGAEYRSGYVWDERRNRYEFRSAVVNGQQAFDSEVQVELSGGRGRIHLTGKLVPPINSRGVDGWWQIDDLRVDRDRITGKYRLNGLNSPKIDIDRRSGRISIDGIEKFRGSCDVGNWSNARNRF